MASVRHAILDVKILGFGDNNAYAPYYTVIQPGLCVTHCVNPLPYHCHK